MTMHLQSAYLHLCFCLANACTVITPQATTPTRRCRWKTTLVNGIVVCGIVLESTRTAVAQRRPIADDTLGAESSLVVPLDPQELSDRIEGGAQRGDNLFHSFREFHVDEGRSVYFADPGVNNILARVTGGVESQILGVLGVLGDANLFLINPSGIIFGDNAQLDLRGSFMATTADAIGFGTQGLFSAIDPTTPPLLTVQPTAALFSQLNPVPIVNNSITPAAANPSGLPEFGLRVSAGENLTLLGGNVRIDRGGLVALGGRVEVGGLSEPGTVLLNADGSLGFPTGVARADVSLSNRVRIIVVGDGGSITVNAGDLEILDSILSAGIASNSGFVGAQAGDITLNASDIHVGGEAGIANQARVGSIGNAGDIHITTDSLSLTNGAILETSTFAQGNAGNVIINAHDRTALDRSAILSSVGSVRGTTLAVGEGGNIRINTASLLLTNGAQLIASTNGRGNAGSVIINAHDRVFLDGGRSAILPSAIFSSVGASNGTTLAVGEGGDIRINTGSLSLANGAQLSASTFGQGNAGDVIINARDRVSLDGQGFADPNLRSSVLSTVGDVAVNRVAIGNGGEIRINTNSLSLSNGAGLVTYTVGQGNAGNITIAIGSLSLSNGAALQTFTGGQGDAGNVSIQARDRVVMEERNQLGNLSGILTETRVGAQGRGGDVSIAADFVRIAEGAAVSTETSNRFPGGTVTLNANTFEAINGGQVITSTSGRGQAGNIILNATDRITLFGVEPNDNLEAPPFSIGTSEQGVVSGLYGSTTPDSLGRGGTVQITTAQLQVFDRASITVGSQGSGIAGNIDLTAARVQLDDQARLTAETAAVDGGNIRLRDVELLQLSNSSRISTSAGTDRAGGNGGNIDIDADFIVVLPNGNSNITADAFTGNGGNVRITTEGLFGIAAQAQDNPFTNDITASSRQGVQGTVDITTPDIDPRRGLTELADEVVDATDQITQSCSDTRAEAGTGEFVVTGRGGVPTSPIDPLVGDESLSNWSTLDEPAAAAASQFPEGAIAPPNRETDGAQIGAIVEAQGWVMEEGGIVRLIATAPTGVAQPSEVCRRPEHD